MSKTQDLLDWAQIVSICLEMGFDELMTTDKPTEPRALIIGTSRIITFDEALEMYRLRNTKKQSQPEFFRTREQLRELLAS